MTKRVRRSLLDESNMGVWRFIVVSDEQEFRFICSGRFASQRVGQMVATDASLAREPAAEGRSADCDARQNTGGTLRGSAGRRTMQSELRNDRPASLQTQSADLPQVLSPKI